MGKPEKNWEEELLDRAREIRKKRSGQLTFEVKLVGASRVKTTISGGPTTWYEEEDVKQENS